MARTSEYRARVGYERLAGKERRYRDTATGEVLSRRQYIKRTEGIPSLENKASRLREMRKLSGIRQPMERYNEYTKQWRKVRGPGARVRGKASEATDFQKYYNILKSKKRQGRKEALRAFDLISQEEFDRDSP